MKFFSFPRKKQEKIYREKGKRKNAMIVISSFFLTHTSISSHARAYTKKSSLKSASLPNKQSAVVVLFSLTVSLSQILS